MVRRRCSVWPGWPREPTGPAVPEALPKAGAPIARRRACGALRGAALVALTIDEPAAKIAATRALAQRAATEDVGDADVELTAPAGLPGRPQRPVLVAPGRVPRRGMHTVHGRAALLHAVAHIEFNALNLALDAVWRYPALPPAYYRDWLQVALEEAHHFTLLRDHLQTLGHDYGDFAAHDGLWEMAEKTASDPIARMALVPRTLEARGLDVTPAMQAKFDRAGDGAAAAILALILADEIGHVAVGNHWYRWLCVRESLDPVAQQARLERQCGAPRLKPPFNLDARRAAGFTRAELAALSRNS